jgi:hypothetical protein
MKDYRFTGTSDLTQSLPWVKSLPNVRKWVCVKLSGSRTSARHKCKLFVPLGPSPLIDRLISNLTMDNRIEIANVLEKEGVKLASNQVEYSLLRQLPETTGLLAECKKRDIALLACKFLFVMGWEII